MKSRGPAKRVTVFVGETDRYDGRALYAAVVAMLHTEGIAGATVTRGVLGYGRSGRTHSAHILDISEDLPVQIVFVDAAEAVDRVLARLDEMVGSGIATIEDVEEVVFGQD